MAHRLSKETKFVDDQLEYLELMASILPDLDYWLTMASLNNTRTFLKTESRFELTYKLPELKELLEQQIRPLLKQYPPKLPISKIAENFRNLKAEEDTINTGVTFGFLNGLMDTKNLNCYEDIPFHFRLSIGPLKGGGGIEEEFLLKDAFCLLSKAEVNYQLLEDASVAFKNKAQPNSNTHKLITDVKYEVANYCRQSVLAFFSFIECFVNSIGFGYLYSNESGLSEEQILVLKGLKKNGSYMNLKKRIESMQMVIREDGKVSIKVADEQQRMEPFTSFFGQYEELRNASVHYSPIKYRIWLGPKDWIVRAREFCDITLEVAQQIWKACYLDSDGPIYIEKLNKQKQLELAHHRLKAANYLRELINTE